MTNIVNVIFERLETQTKIKKKLRKKKCQKLTSQSLMWNKSKNVNCDVSLFNRNLLEHLFTYCPHVFKITNFNKKIFKKGEMWNINIYFSYILLAVNTCLIITLYTKGFQPHQRLISSFEIWAVIIENYNY